MIKILNKFFNSRYFKFSLVVLSAGILSSITYMRQNFEATMLTSFNLTSSQFEELYSLYGIVLTITLFLSGWVTDYFTPRLLLSFSLFVVGLFGLWFANFPAFGALKLIFLIWAMVTGLFFLSAHIKAVKIIARPEEQGRFFGGLDAGRGLVEAAVVTIAAIVFAYMLNKSGGDKAALQCVIYMYSFMCIAIALAVFFLFNRGMARPERKKVSKKGFISDTKMVLSNPLIWLMTIVMFCGWHLLWASFSISNYLQQSYQSSAAIVGIIMAAKLWMRPIGSMGGGFLGDRFSCEKIIAISMLVAILCYVALIFYPINGNDYVLTGIVLLSGITIYAVQGLIWALLGHAKIPLAVTGLAIGIISSIGYSPEMYLPLLYGSLTRHFSPAVSYQLYFGYVAIIGVGGIWAALQFKSLAGKLGTI